MSEKVIGASMESGEYLRTQTLMLAMAKQAEGMDMDVFLDSINSAQTVAPLVDPTLYNKGSAKLQSIKNIAQAFKQFKDVVEQEKAFMSSFSMSSKGGA